MQITHTLQVTVPHEKDYYSKCHMHHKLEGLDGWDGYGTAACASVETNEHHVGGLGSGLGSSLGSG